MLHVRWGPLLLAAGIGVSSFDASACAHEGTPRLAILRISQPLLDSPAREDGYRLEVLADGCVELRYPAWHVDAGDFAFRLRPEELARLRKELSASGLAQLDPASTAGLLTRSLERKGTTARIVHSSDPVLTELTVTVPGREPQRFRLRGVEHLPSGHAAAASLAPVVRSLRLLRALESHPARAPVPARRP